MRSAFRLLLPALASLLFVLLYWGAQYARRGHWEPDEARFVYVAREMAETHSFIVPRRNGEIYAHKPPLMMWLIMTGEALFGEPFGSRLPTLIGAALSVLAFFSIAARLAGRRIAAYAVLVASTSIQFWSALGFGQIDALLTGLVLSSAALFLSRHGKVATAKILPAFLCAGLAILAKGPVGLVLPVLIVAAVRIPRRDGPFPELSPAQWCIGFAATLLVPALWLCAAALSGAPASYFREILFSQNVTRAAGGYGHCKPFWYLAAQFPAGFMPWTLLLPVAIAALLKKNRVLLRQCSLWVLLIVLFFSIPASKRGVYILAAYPGAALLVAAAADTLGERQWCRRAVAATVIGIPAILLAAGTLLLCCGLDAEIPPPIARTPDIVFGISVACLAGAVLSGACITLLFAKSANRHWAVLPAVSLSAVFICAGAIALPALNPVKEPFGLVPVVERTVPPDGRLLLFRINGESLALHARRRGLRVEDDESMREAMASEGAGLAVFRLKDASNLLGRFPTSAMETGSFAMGNKSYVWMRFVEEPHQPPPLHTMEKP